MSDCITSFDTDRRMLRSCRRTAKHFEHVWVTWVRIVRSASMKIPNCARMWLATRDQNQQPADQMVADFVDELKRTALTFVSDAFSWSQLKNIQSATSWSLHGWSSKLAVGTTFSRYCADYTGFRCQNIFHSGWQCWCIAAYMALHLATLGLRSSARHTSMHVDDCALRLQQRWSLHALCVLPLATAPFQRLLHRSGTVCRSRSGRLRRCKFSTADWKPNFLPALTVMTNNVSLHWLLLHDFTVTCPCSLRT